MATPPQPGLRERKRVATRARIAEAALDLALTQGIEGATIDAISAAADVSPRTFFNYFDSKDAALLGSPDRRDLGTIIEQLGPSADELSARELAVHICVEWVRPHLEPRFRRDDRIRLLERHPHLVGAAARQLQDVQQDIASRVRSHAALHGPAIADPAWADILVAAAVAAVRVVLERSTPGSSVANADDVEVQVNALLVSVHALVEP